MKKSDIAMIVLIAGISMAVAFVIANQLSFLKVPDQGETVKSATAIDSSVDPPDKAVFNSSAINPTVQIFIGGDGSGS